MNARLAYPRTLPGSVVSACHLAVALESGVAHRLLRRLPTDPGRHRGGARNAAVALLVCPTAAASASHACRAKSARHSLRIVFGTPDFFWWNHTYCSNKHTRGSTRRSRAGGRAPACLPGSSLVYASRDPTGCALKPVRHVSLDCADSMPHLQQARSLPVRRRGCGVRSGLGAARTILLFHTISARPSKQPRMVGSTLGYIGLG